MFGYGSMYVLLRKTSNHSNATIERVYGLYFSKERADEIATALRAVEFEPDRIVVVPYPVEPETLDAALDEWKDGKTCYLVTVACNSVDDFSMVVRQLFQEPIPLLFACPLLEHGLPAMEHQSTGYLFAESKRQALAAVARRIADELEKEVQ